jgi:hypothetical protein
LLHLTNNQILISQIEEVAADIGEPDCKLIKPYEVSIVDKEKVFLSPWMNSFTEETTFKISSDKILALTEPSPTVLGKYEDLIKE